MSSVNVKKQTKGILTTLATIGMLMVAQTVLGAGEVIEVKPLDTGILNKVTSNVYWLISGVGGTFILVMGMWHTLFLSAAAKNGNKKAMYIEAIGVVFASLFLFYAFPWLAGVLRGVAETGM